MNCGEPSGVSRRVVSERGCSRRSARPTGEQAMNEEEWLTRPTPRKLLEHLEEYRLADARKLRLFAIACCYRVQAWFIDPRQHTAIEVLEQFVDGDMSAEELENSMLEVQRICDLDTLCGEGHGDKRDHGWAYAVYHAAQVISQATCNDLPGGDNPTLIDRAHDIVMNTVDALVATSISSLHAQEIACQTLCEFLRDIFGNPFRPVAFTDSWRSETVVALATSIYADRAFDRLPVLADALEEAGCDHPDVLAHCRGPGPHVRGCWVVDLLLGKV
jgi:hypothetical protein